MLVSKNYNQSEVSRYRHRQKVASRWFTLVQTHRGEGETNLIIFL
jgi:hypothetical protein